MAGLQQRCAGRMAACWLVALLLHYQRVATAAPPLWPLALELQGRTYGLLEAQKRLELPLDCGKDAMELGVQHRVPALRLQHQCAGALSVLAAGTPGRTISLWSGEEVAPPTIAHDPAESLRQRGDSAVAAPSTFWFRFQLDPSIFQAGAEYKLHLSMFCDGWENNPTLLTAITVLAATCAAGNEEQPQTQTQQVQVQAAQAQPAAAWPSMMLPGSAAAVAARARSSRQLAEGDGIPVLLRPSSSGGATILDGFSGLARPINGSDAGGPCVAAGTTAGGRCLSNLLVRIASSCIRLNMQLAAGGSAAALTGEVLPSAFAVTGGSVSEVPVLVDGDTVEVALTLDGQGPATVYVPQGALMSNGVSNADSNTLTIELDDTPPVPVITTPGNVGVTSATQISFSIDFGEQVLASDPFSLFNYAGAERLDAVLNVAAGQLDIAVYVLPQAQGDEADITVWVVSDTVSDLVGNRNNISNSLTVKYRPTSSGLQGMGMAANVLLGTSVALCTSASYLASHLLPFSTAVLGCGALSFVGWAQTFYLTSGLAVQWMPESYKQVAGTFGWTVGEIGLAWADSSPEMDPNYAFPWASTVLASTGQVVVQQNPADLAADKQLVALTGELSLLNGEGQVATSVLDGIPFLNPIEVQMLDATGSSRKLKRAPALPMESTSGRWRRLQADARRGRRSMLRLGGAPPLPQPAFEGTLYVVSSRGLQRTTPDGVTNTADVLVGGSAVQRAYDVIDAAGDNGSYPRQHYYDRLARTAFWTALFVFTIMVLHLGCLGWMMWQHAKVLGVMWFPRIEVVVCLAVLPGLAYGTSGLFNCGVGDIALGALLLALLPCSFLLTSFYLVWRWLQNPALNERRAIFVLRQDPLTAQIAMRTPSITPATTPRTLTHSQTPGITPRDGSDSATSGSDRTASKEMEMNGGKAEAERAGSKGALPNSLGASSAATPPSPASQPAGLPPATVAEMHAASTRRWSFTGLVRSLCSSRKLQGDWCGINLDSRFTLKYGPLFELTYGQAMARRRATYEFDGQRSKVDRGALVPLPELATISWKGRALVEPHHLRTPAQLLGVTKTLMLAVSVSGVVAMDSYIQCCLLILLYGFYTIYLLAVRPYNVALVGAFELVTTLCTLATSGLTMALMDGRGSSDFTRSVVGTIMLILQFIGYCCFIAGTWWVSLRSMEAATGLRRHLHLKPSPSDRFAEVVREVMANDPNILARKFLDRWMVRALGVGLYNRPVWRRETEDLRRLLCATTLPKRKVAHMGSVVRCKGVSPGLGGGGMRLGAFPSGPLPPVLAVTEGLPPSSSGSDRGNMPRYMSGRSVPGGAIYVAAAPAFNAPAPDRPAAADSPGSSDTVIVVPVVRRSPPRELAAQTWLRAGRSAQRACPAGASCGAAAAAAGGGA